MACDNFKWNTTDGKLDRRYLYFGYKSVTLMLRKLDFVPCVIVGTPHFLTALFAYVQQKGR